MGGNFEISKMKRWFVKRFRKKIVQFLFSENEKAQVLMAMQVGEYGAAKDYVNGFLDRQSYRQDIMQNHELRELFENNLWN